MSRIRLPRAAALGAALVFATALVYAPVRHHEFLVYDDDGYITDNPHIQGGIDAATVAWAFTTLREGNWHPLTWLSHAADVTVFGLDPTGHHLVNVLLHLASTVVLLLVLWTATGSAGRSAFVAGVFALHPLHVESVAWAAERKDVLSALLFMLTLAAYVRYAERGGRTRLAVVTGLLGLGLLAKPMLVTAPFVLLLVDRWPLDRAPRGRIVEKLPLFALAAVSSVVTAVAQNRGGAMSGLDVLPLGMRVANAVVAIPTYLARAVWPVRLGVLYPHERLLAWQIVGAALFVAAVTLVAIRLRRRAPWLLVGWLWYVGMLVPVLGLVQVGAQATADRYTYLPLVGVAIVIGWGVPELVAERWRRAHVPAVLATAALACCAGVTSRQLGFWRDSRTLFERTLAVTTDNPVIHNNLGGVLFREGRVADAEAHFVEARRLKPDYAEAISNLGLAHAGRGAWTEAIALYQEALEREPGHPQAWFNLAIAHERIGDADEAVRCYREALRLAPGRPEVEAALRQAEARAGGADDEADAHYRRGNALRQSGRLDEALAEYREAVRLAPGHADAHNNLGSVLGRLGRYAEAIAALERALELDPALAAARNNLGIVLALDGRTDEALRRFDEVLRLDPRDATAHYNAARLLAERGRRDEAIEHLEAALRLDPGYSEARAALEQLRRAS